MTPAGPRSALSYLGLGFEIAVPIVLGVLGGRWLDRRLATEPWWTIAGAVLGIGAGFWSFFRTVLGRKDEGSR